MPTRHTPGAEQVGIISHFREGEPHHGKCGASQLEGVRNVLLGIWPCVRWFGEDLRKQGFAVVWMLSSRGAIP